MASSASTVRDQLLLELGHADLADQVVEEAVHDQAARLVLGDAARAQVEQLLVVEAAGRRRVAGALDLAGLDLEVGHRVGLAAVGEDQVAVLLVGLDALGDLADQHVADPDRVRALALQRALVDDVALGVRRVVVDEQPVLDVLAGVGEVEAEHLGRAAGTGVLDVGVVPDHVAAEGDGDVLVASRRGRPGPWWCARWTASSAQSWSETTVSSAPSPTTISTLSASVAEPGVAEHHGRLGCARRRAMTSVAGGGAVDVRAGRA